MDRRRQMRTRVRHDREVGKSESRSGEGGGGGGREEFGEAEENVNLGKAE